jgi:hypothetical protein
MKKNIRNHISYSFDAPIVKIECDNCNEKSEIQFPATIKEWSEIGMDEPINKSISFIRKHNNCKKKNNVRLLSKKKNKNIYLQ